MEIVYKLVEDLNPYKNNPRKNEKAVKMVAASIRDFGFKVPITIDKNNSIVTGHTRLKAAIQLGMKEVPCIILDDLTPDQIKAFRIADNRTSEIAEWDYDALAIELSEIEIDMTPFEIQIPDAGDKIKEDEYDIKLPLVPKSKTGEIYQIGKHRLMCGDARKRKDVLQLVEGAVVDLVFTDPPYNVDYEGTAGKIMNDKMDDKPFYHFLFESFKNMFEVSKLGGAIYVCHADTEGLNFRNAFHDAGYKLAECLVWVKNSLVLGRQDYHWRHEPILYGWKEGGPHFFVNDRTQDTVWEYNKPRRNGEHPTMKPIELCGRAINNSSRSGELVLDLFGGSGSTMIAADQLGRRCFMMEIDPQYVDVIIDRYEKFTGTKAVRINDGSNYEII